MWGREENCDAGGPIRIIKLSVTDICHEKSNTKSPRCCCAAGVLAVALCAYVSVSRCPISDLFLEAMSPSMIVEIRKTTPG